MIEVTLDQEPRHRAGCQSDPGCLDRAHPWRGLIQAEG